MSSPAFAFGSSAFGVGAFGGTAAAWDSAAYSPQPFLNGCYIAWTAAGDPTAAQMCGLSSNPSVTPNETSLDLGLETNNGSIFVSQLGTLLNSGASLGSYVIGDTFEVRYDGVTGRFFHNGALLMAVRAPGLKLSPKVCLFSPTSVVGGLSYGPASAVNQPTGSLLNTYPWIIGASGNQGNYIDAAGAGNPASKVVQAGSGSAPLGPYGTSEAIWEAQGTISGTNGGWSDNGDLFGIDPTKTYRSVVWVYWNGTGTGTPKFFHGCDPTYTNNLNGTQNTNPFFTNGISLGGSFAPGKWYLAVGFIQGSGYSGASSGQSGVYDPATGNQISVGTDFVNIAGALFQTQRVSHAGDTSAAGILHFAKPRFEEANGNEPTLQALMAPASALQGFVTTGNAEVSGTTVSKLGGAAAWDSCVYSVNGYPQAHIAAKPVGTLAAMFGFSTTPALSSSFTNGNYLWCNDGAGNWQIYESGTLISTFAAVAATDLAEITYDGTTITYLLNKAPQRTVSISGLLLYAFLPLNAPNSGWSLVDFGPTDVTGVIDTSGIGNNAATATIVQTLAGPAALTPSASVGLNPITVGPYPYATTLVCTMTGGWNVTTGANAEPQNVAIGVDGVGTGAVATNFSWNPKTNLPASTTINGTLVAESTLSLAANATMTVFTFVTMGGVVFPATTSAFASNIVTKVEVIKK
jgi:hypothetical protein